MATTEMTASLPPIRLSEDDRDLVRRAAEADERPMSAWVRRALRDAARRQLAATSSVGTA